LSSYELFIGLRYTRARRRNHFISFISGTSMVGIALGVAALIVVLSVMNGFQKEIRGRILAAASHIQITGPDNRLGEWRKVIDEVSRHAEVAAAAPYVMAQGLLSFEARVHGSVIRGIVPSEEAKVADFARHMKSGSVESLRSGAFNIVLGAELARSLSAGVGDQVVLIAPQGQVTPAGVLPRLRQFRVSGIFEIGMFEYDSGLALIHLEDGQRLYRIAEDVSGVRLRIRNLDAAPVIARELARMVSVDAYISDWTRSHATYFRALQIEKRMMFIILSLIVAVAAFNIVSTLVMVVTDKNADIAILRTLGASPSSIVKIFMVQGTLIGVIGTTLGIALGVLLALNIDVVVPAIEQGLGVKILAKEVYYISDLPSDLHWFDVFRVGAIAFVLAFLATIYPSWRASRVNPADALRYE
jgi:lipoprotein-releasing system permease protein